MDSRSVAFNLCHSRVPGLPEYLRAASMADKHSEKDSLLIAANVSLQCTHSHRGRGGCNIGHTLSSCRARVRPDSLGQCLNWLCCLGSPPESPVPPWQAKEKQRAVFEEVGNDLLLFSRSTMFIPIRHLRHMSKSNARMKQQHCISEHSWIEHGPRCKVCILFWRDGPHLPMPASDHTRTFTWTSWSFSFAQEALQNSLSVDVLWPLRSHRGNG